MTPALHAGLLGASTISVLVFAGVILARGTNTTAAARMHAIYGGLVAWWLFSMAMVATADESADVELWARLLHLSLGALPAVIFQLNMVTAGLARRWQRSIRVHYGVAVAVIGFCLVWPDLLGTPHEYRWGWYPNYSAWGLVPVVAVVVAMLEVLWIYKRTIRAADSGTAYRRKLEALYRGNAIASLALLDFLPVFGVGLYPFGYVTMTFMAGGTVFACVRYRLIDITPEFAAAQILSTLPDCVFVVDSQNLIRLANRASARTFDRRVSELLDRSLIDIVPELSLVDNDDGPVQEGDVRLHLSGDRVRVMRVSCAELRDQLHHSVGKVWVLHDLTEQRQAEAEKDELEGWVRHGQKLETLGVMARGIAHDFNNLLTAILGNADIALSKLPGEADVSPEVRIITTAAERATDLTSQMLTFAGEVPTVAQPVDLNGLCIEISELIHAAVSKRAKLDLVLDDELPQVEVDKGQMSQVILNLITNASEALEGAVGTITLRTSLLLTESAKEAGAGELTRFACLEVTDTGVGMDRDTRERIFDPFFTTKFAGHGLRLATVMGIVEAHGGRIRIETEPGRGTSVTMALPAIASGAEHNPTTRRMAGGRIAGDGIVLVADDEPDVCKVVGDMLRGAGYGVLSTSEGNEAVEVFRTRRDEISCVLLDLAMPEMDGIEAMSNIRELSPEVPIILMSGYSDVESAAGASDIGALFLRKPFRSGALLSKVELALTNDKLQP